MIARLHSSLVAFACAGVLAAAPRVASASPSVAECLAANEASIGASDRSALREEREKLVTCAAPSCPAEVREECLRRLDEVNRALPTLVFRAVDTAGNELVGVQVSMDGEVLAQRLTGVALPVDPGEHTFVFETPGRASVTRRFVVRAAEKERLETIVFEAAAALPAKQESSGLGGQRTLALVAGGVGVAGLVVGSIYGLTARSRRNEARELCPKDCADDAGVEAWRDAARAGNTSTVAFLVGGAALATGIVLWVTAPDESAGRLRVGLGRVGWEGTF